MEILFYDAIYDESVRSFVTQLSEAKQLRENVEVKIDSPGGVVTTGFAALAEIKAFPNELVFNVQGEASSMFAFALLFGKTKASSRAQFTFHRASSFFGDSQALRNINELLRNDLESSVDSDLFAEISGITIEEMFSMDSRIDVTFTAQEMQRLGIVDEIYDVSPQDARSIVAYKKKQQLSFKNRIAAINEPNTMTKEELKAKHPDIYASIVKEGVDYEKDRIKGWSEWADVNLEKAIEGIKGESQIKPSDISAFTKEQFLASQANSLGENNKPSQSGNNDGDKLTASKEGEDLRKRVVAKFKQRI